MSPVNHFLTGWLVANANPSLQRRERTAVTLACVIPDVDGLGIIGDLWTRDAARPLALFAEYHHTFGHNIFFAAALGIAVFLFTRGNRAATALALISYHLHLLEDVFSGRYEDGSAWPIHYLYPFSTSWGTWQWEGQYALNAWPNFVAAATLLGAMFYLAWKRGFSPLEMISRKADQALVFTLRQRFGHPDSV